MIYTWMRWIRKCEFKYVRFSLCTILLLLLLLQRESKRIYDQKLYKNSFPDVIDVNNNNNNNTFYCVGLIAACASAAACECM